LRAHRRSSPCHWARLPAGRQSTIRDLRGARAHSSSGEGFLGRGGVGASRGPHRHKADAGVYDEPQCAADAADDEGDPAKRAAEPVAGRGWEVASFLWRCGVFDVGAADGQVRHPESLLGYEPSWIERRGAREKSRSALLIPLVGLPAIPPSRQKVLGRVYSGLVTLPALHSSRGSRFGCPGSSCGTWRIGVRLPGEKVGTYTRFPPTSPCTAMLRTWGTVGRWAQTRRLDHRVCGRAAVCGRRRKRAEAITLRELKAVRLLLQRHFSSYVAQEDTKRIPLHEDNQAVVHILNAMVSASRPMMAELRRLEVMLRALGIRIESRWLPSAVNRYADTLSRQWDPRDVRVTEELVQSLSNAYALGAVVFPHCSVGEHPIARRKYLETQMAEDCGDGPAMEPAVRPTARVGEEDRGRPGTWVLIAPRWPAQPGYGRLRR
jgi:hypothetical protein